MLHELGHGAYGTVCLVRHKRLNTLRAVKYIESRLDGHDFMNEANLLKNLKHPGIPVIYDVEESEEGIFVIEEYIDGETLYDKVNNNGKLSEKEACEIAIQICDILDYLHNNEVHPIMHLDLKPDNVMLSKKGEVKIIDFNSAAIVSEGVKKCEGSIGFAAPEQYHRLRPDCLCDVYALGMLFLFMLTGSHEPPDVKSIKSNRISNVIKKCIRHNPAQRYRSAKAVSADIKKILRKQTGKAFDLSLTVNLTGSKRGIGTTHIALALTYFLTNEGYKAVYMDKTGENRIYDILGNAVLCDNAAYSMFGIYLLPDYGGCIEVDEKWEIIVCDCGTAFLSGEPPAASAVLNVLVGCAKPEDETGFNARLSEFIVSAGNSKNAVILNHMSGSQFYRYVNAYSASSSEKGDRYAVNNNRKHTCMFRMPCHYEWHSFDAIVYQMFGDMLGEYLPMENSALTGFGKNIKLWRRVIERCRRVFRKIIRRLQQNP